MALMFKMLFLTFLTVIAVKSFAQGELEYGDSTWSKRDRRPSVNVTSTIEKEASGEQKVDFKRSLELISHKVILKRIKSFEN